MAGFIRRFGNFPSDAALTAIEGVNIIDLPPPGSIEGVGTGTACLIGEFADMTFAVEVNETTGAIAESLTPIEVFSSQDMLNKVGGFDASLGQFGGDMGNGFVELRNKKFFRLILVPINLASAVGLRLWRALPTNISATNANPIVPVPSAIVDAGRVLVNGLDRLKTAARFVFSDAISFITGVDGSVTATAPAVIQTFDSAGSTFQTDGVVEGDALVLGVLGGAGALGANAATYRVVSVTSEIAIVVEKQDGTAFDWTTGASLPFRLHRGTAADSGADNQFSEAAGYLVAARPLTDGQATGADAVDNTWAVGTLLTPELVPPVATASDYNPLSGLSGATNPSTTLDFTTALQKANPANDAALDAKYSAAMTALLAEESPSREVNLLWAARKSDTIRSGLKQHELDASAQGIGRTGVISPELDIAKLTALTTVTGDTAPGVGATRDERTDYSWPPVLTFVPEAVGTLLATADGKTTDEGILDLTMDGFLISILSNLAPERNPGESSAVTRAALAGVLGIARNVPKLSMNSYIALRNKGIAGIRIDRVVGPVIQSGITSSLISGQKNINRRRMADFIEDSIAARMVQLVKLPLTESLKRTAVSETTEFLEGLLSTDNPPAQRINDYAVDDKSGNTPELEAKGVFVIIVRVRTLATADFITIQAEIGEGVVITTTT